MDEAGIHKGMRPTTGWSGVGVPPVFYGPVKGKNHSVIGALTRQGPVAPFVLEGATDGDAFVYYIEHVLLPVLLTLHTPERPVLLVLDNVRFHHNPLARLLLEEHGIQLLFLPPYSPDLNPIEEMWSKVKHKVRRLLAQGRRTLLQALGDALDTVTTKDAFGWFAHAGWVQRA